MSSKMQPNSPLRYPGGKGKLSNFFAELMKTNGLNNGIYVEPFAGGAAVAVSLLLEGAARKIVINDLDKSIWAFWRTLLDRTEELVEATMSAPLTVDEWMRQKKILQGDNSSVFDLGFATFFMNRTNRSGTLNAGGGLDQQGRYKIDARFNRDGLSDRIRRIAEKSEQIEVHNLDAEDFVQRVLLRLPRDETLAYFDPPYYVKGRALYMNYYHPEDHRSLSRAIKALPYFWCVSYDDVPEARALYSHHRIRRYQLDYCAHSRRKGAEMMVFSRRIRLPLRMRLPSQVS